MACLHVVVAVAVVVVFTVDALVVLRVPIEKHGSHTLTGSYSCSAGNGTRLREQSAQKILPQLLKKKKI